MDEPVSRAEREARRSLLQDALAKLGEPGVDADRAAFDVMRALDAYLDQAGRPPSGPPPARSSAGGDARNDTAARWVAALLVGGAVIATIVVAVAMSGGWPTGLAVAAIWVATVALLVTAG